MNSARRQIDDKALLLSAHPSVHGLSDEVVQEIADACELTRWEPGEWIHRADEAVTSWFLVIHGRIAIVMKDILGDVVFRRSQTAGGQFGGVAASLVGPGQVDCFAEDPSTILRLDYAKVLELTAKHQDFRLNVDRALAESIRQTLSRDSRPTPPSRVVVLHESPDTRVVSERLFERLTSLGETLGVATDRTDWSPPDGVQLRSLIEDGELIPPEERQRTLATWLEESRRVFIDIEATLDLAFTDGLLAANDLILWCVTPGRYERTCAHLRNSLVDDPGLREKITIVWLLDGHAHAPLAPELKSLAAHDLKVSFEPPADKQNRALMNGMARLVQAARGVRIGVALGGGAARGMAHLGVLKALEREGIAIDMISGTSAGAMTGTFYAAGWDMDWTARQFAEDVRPSWIFRRIPSGAQWHLLYKYRTGQFDPMLRPYLRDLHYEQLAIPVSAVSLDLVSGEAVVRDSGDAVHGITESINLPVLAPPIIRGGQALVDGGMINNIPADVLINKGCNFVIAVSVTSKLEHEFSGSGKGKTKPASTIKTILRTFVVQSANLNAIGIKPADIVIEPDVTSFELTDFPRAPELAAVGEQATMDALPKIRKALARFDPLLFGSSVQPAPDVIVPPNVGAATQTP